jgi:hypothetical protein
MAIKNMAVDAFVAPDSAITKNDLEYLDKLSTAEEKDAAARGIAKRVGIEVSKKDTYEAIKAKLEAYEGYTTADKEGPSEDEPTSI